MMDLVRCGASAVIGAIALGLSAQPVVIDGLFDDWSVVPTLVDPKGDHQGGGWDLGRVWTTTDGVTVSVSFEIGRAANLQSGPDAEGDLVLTAEVEGGEMAIVDFRARTWTIESDGVEREVGWDLLGYRSAPTYAARRFEVSLDLAAIGAAPGGVVTIDFSGDDTLSEPITMVLGEVSDERVPPVSLKRPEQAALRVASLNTLRGGLVHRVRQQPLMRLLTMSEADVFCLQEEFETPSEEIHSAFVGAFGDESWTIEKTGRGTAVVTRLQAEPINLGSRAPGAALLVTTRAGERVAVVSVHLKCCGHAGSEEDTRRVDQVEQIMSELEDSMAAKGIQPDATLVIGDWNLVGSRRPLDLAEGHGMRWLRPRQIESLSPMTWVNAESEFPPGQLDLAVLGGEGFDHSRALTVDTRSMNEEMLGRLGLTPEDSAATDHLLLIADVMAEEVPE
ncbi:MAG: endonuclease/exonuclease/phosphatase family protein [Planctomycetota bacterium]